MFDVVIIGGSFAGLATAMALRDHRVLVIEQYPIGARQSSTCGIPLRLAQMVGAERAVQQAHPALVMHAAGRETTFPLPEPYATFEYRAFCQAMLAQTNAEVWQARATGIDGNTVTTTSGDARGRFIVDASGWRSFRNGFGRPPEPLEHAGRGIETELPVQLNLTPGLHFYFERRIVRKGYAWVFPCGDTVRIGLVSAEERAALRRRLDEFVAGFGLETGDTHGGVIPVVRREPMAGDVFVVGDAAGQCLALTDEGIRIAIRHGLACGQTIAGALRGEITPEQARARYRRVVRDTEGFHRNLVWMMKIVDRTPETALHLAARACSPPPVAKFILNRYLRQSGWHAA